MWKIIDEISRENTDAQESSGKGQIMSEWIYEFIDFPSYQLKNLKDFCPKSLFEAQSKISTNNFEYAWQT